MKNPLKQIHWKSFIQTTVLAVLINYIIALISGDSQAWKPAFYTFVVMLVILGALILHIMWINERKE